MNAWKTPPPQPSPRVLTFRPSCPIVGMTGPSQLDHELTPHWFLGGCGTTLPCYWKAEKKKEKTAGGWGLLGFFVARARVFTCVSVALGWWSVCDAFCVAGVSVSYSHSLNLHRGDPMWNEAPVQLERELSVPKKARTPPKWRHAIHGGRFGHWFAPSRPGGGGRVTTVIRHCIYVRNIKAGYCFWFCEGVWRFWPLGLYLLFIVGWSRRNSFVIGGLKHNWELVLGWGPKRKIWSPFMVRANPRTLLRKASFYILSLVAVIVLRFAEVIFTFALFCPPSTPFLVIFKE